MSFRRPSRSPLARSIARLLIAALLVAFLPADASASLPPPTSTLFEELPERTFPVLSEAQAAVVVLAELEDGAWLVLLLPAAALCGVGCGAADPHFPIKYHRARWMTPSTGRFAGMDPANGIDAEPLSLHKYLHAHGDPANRTDPTGRFATGAEIAVVNAIVGQIASQQLALGADVVNELMFRDNFAVQAVFIGVSAVASGAAIYGISKLGLRLLNSNAFRRFLSRLRPGSIRPNVGTHRDLRGSLPAGHQSNHLNQNAAYRGVIPPNEGAAVGMRGNAFTEPGTPHFEFHSSLEKWWDDYRPGGRLHPVRPTNAEYDSAMRRALDASGFSGQDVEALAGYARRNRLDHGLLDSDPVPRIPGRIPRKKQ